MWSEKTCPLFDTATWDSNPGSLSQESQAVATVPLLHSTSLPSHRLSCAPAVPPSGSHPDCPPWSCTDRRSPPPLPAHCGSTRGPP